MSKFEKFDVKNGNNQFGDNNTQNNITNNTVNNKVSKDTDSSGVIIGAITGMAGLTWFFFSHINQIYHYLNIVILSSFLFSIGAFFILVLTTSVTRTDIFRVFASTFLAISLYGLALLARNHAPNEIIQFAHQALMCAEKTGGFNLVNYRHSSGVYHEQETEDLHRRI
ncbi:hypothetical protein J715_4397 [Acinetobacter baumannii 1571545]|nr:hypothetical protein J715_4397 [Acinetobacter baumannii 1571545]